jgi:hypothetical protein
MIISNNYEDADKLLHCIIGISFAGFDEDTFTDQVSLFDLVEENANSDKQEKIDLVMDKIRSRHGTSKISRATLIKKDSRQNGIN